MEKAVKMFLFKMIMLLCNKLKPSLQELCETVIIKDNAHPFHNAKVHLIILKAGFFLVFLEFQD